MRRFSGARLRALRLAAGLSAEHLALQVQRSVYSIHEYERGRSRPTANVLADLAAALGCTIDDFYAVPVDADVA